MAARSTKDEMTYTERRMKVATLYLEGWRQSDLAERFGVNQSTISRDLAAIRQQWLESTLIDFNEAKARELARIDKLARQCRAIEIAPAYVAVALQRYQDAFGITPELVE